MNDLLASPEAIKEAARIIHAFLKAKFPGMTEGDRDDIEQDVKLKLLKMGAGGKKIDHLKSYLWRAVYTTALDALDRKQAQFLPGLEAVTAKVAGEGVPSSSRPGPDALFERHEESRALGEAVGSLPSRRRTVLELHLLGMDIPESAAFLGWSEPTVRHLLYRGIADLKRKMGGNGRWKGGS